MASPAMRAARESRRRMKGLTMGLGTYVTIGDSLLSLLLERDGKGMGPSRVSSSSVPPNSCVWWR
jgi:hypothetical protein